MTARSWSRDRECERAWKVFCQGGIFGAGLNLNMAFSGNFLHILPSLFQIWQLFVILKLRIKSQHFEKCSQPLPATCSASQASSMTARWCWTGSGRAQSLRGINLVREELGLPGSLGHILETVLPWWRRTEGPWWSWWSRLRETWGSSSGYRMGRGVCVNAGERLERSKKQFTYETQKIV